ncbi:MAG: hypothetical protein WBZ19_28715 [Chthoniobacterales bacterium]
MNQALKMATQHFGHGFELWDTAANDPAIPKVKKLLGGFHIRALPKRIEELFSRPGSGGFKLATH